MNFESGGTTRLNLQPGEEVLFQTRPALRSFWVFTLGLVICLAAPLSSQEPPFGLAAGVFFAAIFALIILRRWSNFYTLTDRRLLLRAGLIGRDTYEITLPDLTTVEVNQGLTLRLVKAGHVLARSRVPSQALIIIYGQ
ncbi:MAG: PH domain-containing protein, partial [Pseudomonadota bacterium]